MKQMTKGNLESAFAGESQAHMKYKIYADKAEREGYPEVARLFKAISYAEEVHATNHFRQLGNINATKENLDAAAAGETYEVNEMYPAFDAVARLQEEKGALQSIGGAWETEKIHLGLYEEAVKYVAEGHDIAKAKVFICPVCGHTAIAEAPEKCPICGAKKERYIEF